MNAKEMVDVFAAVATLVLPDAQLTISAPRETTDGHWWIDLHREAGKESYAIEFRPPDKWGVHVRRPGDAFEGPDEVFSEPSSLIAWLVRNRK